MTKSHTAMLNSNNKKAVQGEALCYPGKLAGGLRVGGWGK